MTLDGQARCSSTDLTRDSAQRTGSCSGALFEDLCVRQITSGKKMLLKHNINLDFRSTRP